MRSTFHDICRRPAAQWLSGVRGWRLVRPSTRGQWQQPGHGQALEQLELQRLSPRTCGSSLLPTPARRRLGFSMVPHGWRESPSSARDDLETTETSEIRTWVTSQLRKVEVGSATEIKMVRLVSLLVSCRAWCGEPGLERRTCESVTNQHIPGGAASHEYVKLAMVSTRGAKVGRARLGLAQAGGCETIEELNKTSGLGQPRLPAVHRPLRSYQFLPPPPFMFFETEILMLSRSTYSISLFVHYLISTSFANTPRRTRNAISSERNAAALLDV